MRTAFIYSLVLAALLFVGCEKISTSDNGTLYGSWSVREESASMNPRTYLADIRREPVDTTIVIINNFNNLGSSFELYCRLKDSTLTIFQTNGEIPGYSFSGNGIYHKSARLITWVYVVNTNSGSDQVYARFTRN